MDGAKAFEKILAAKTGLTLTDDLVLVGKEGKWERTRLKNWEDAFKEDVGQNGIWLNIRKARSKVIEKMLFARLVCSTPIWIQVSPDFIYDFLHVYISNDACGRNTSRIKVAGYKTIDWNVLNRGWLEGYVVHNHNIIYHWLVYCSIQLFHTVLLFLLS